MIVALLAACSDVNLAKDDETPTGTPTGEAGLCPDYSGFGAVGQTWSWTFSNTSYDSVSSVELVSIVDDRVTLQTSAEATGATFTGTWERVTTWRCDAEGAWLVSETVDTVQEETGAYPYTYADTVTSTYSPGWLLVPVGMDSGSSWDVDFDLGTISATWGESTQPWEGTYFVENGEEVVTEAGTFQTLEVNGAGELDGGTWMDHDFRDRDAGVVLDDTGAQLTAWTPA